MFSTVRSQILLLVTTLVVVSAVLVVLITRNDFKLAAWKLHSELDRDLLQFVVKTVDNEYTKLIYKEIDIVAQRREMLANITEGVLTMMAFSSRAYLDMGMSDEEANRVILDQISNIRYGNNQYFFVFNEQLKGLAHPITDMVGKKWSGYEDLKKRDAFSWMNRSGAINGSGFSLFRWPRLSDNSTVRQLAYYAYDSERKWTIATSVEIDDLQYDLEESKNEIIRQLSLLFEDLTFAGSGFVFILDGKGESITQSNSAQLISNFSTIPFLKKLQKSIEDEKEFFIHTIGNNSRASQKFYISGIYFKPLDWYVCVALDNAKVFKPVKKLLKRQGTVLGGILFLAIITALIICHRISWPLRTLSDFAKKLSLINIKKGISVKDEFASPPKAREVKQLYEAIKYMEDQLKSNVLELDRFNYQLGELVKERTLELETTTEEIKNQHALLEISNSEKEVLLKELYHRTKNNMLVIISLLQLQADEVEDEQLSTIFKETENRIRVMSLVHEKLLESQNLSELDLGEYLADVAGSIIHSMSTATEISIDLDADPFLINIDNAIPLGLVVNEIITNSIKHAFPAKNQQGIIQIILRKTHDNSIELIIGDNGIGIPDDFDINLTSSFGMQIILNLLKHQLKGNCEVRNFNGTQFIIQFPIPKKSTRV